MLGTFVYHGDQQGSIETRRGDARRLFIDSCGAGSRGSANFSEAKAYRIVDRVSAPINPPVHSHVATNEPKNERTNQRASFLVVATAARRTRTHPRLRPWKIAPLRPRERQKRKGCYRARLPVSINVAGLFPDISRCRAKIYLPLAERISIDTRGRDDGRKVRWRRGREREQARFCRCEASATADLAIPRGGIMGRKSGPVRFASRSSSVNCVTRIFPWTRFAWRDGRKGL